MIAHSLINIKKYNMHICTFKIDNVWLCKNKKKENCIKIYTLQIYVYIKTLNVPLYLLILSLMS